jgi:putative thiamine transport system permease protein
VRESGRRHIGSLLDLALLLVLGLPIVVGLAGTVLPAFGYLPAIGATVPGFGPWAALFSYPGFWPAVRFSFTTGLAATIIALALAAGLCASLRGTMPLRRVEAVLAPLLAAPHAAIAIGLAFVLAPSGWVVRLISPWLTGWRSPPDVATIGDRYGVALVVGLLVKEVPYLLLIIMAALNQVSVAPQLKAARALGYSRGVAWIKIVFPQVYAQIRLPIFVVLAFSMSVVDMALVLGPSEPAPLSILALRWFSAPDVSRYPPAAAAALVQLGLVGIVIGLWMAGEVVARRLGRIWIARGDRGWSSEPGLKALRALTVVTFVLGMAALLSLVLWSFAWRWAYPAPLPTAWTLDNWQSHLDSVVWPLSNTLLVALATTAIGGVLVVGWLETPQRRLVRSVIWAIYLPLLLPQIAFLFGMQVSLIWIHLDGTLVAVIWSHLVFVVPYMLIALADPWFSLDRRYARAAASLGASPWRILIRIKLPILLRPLLIAAAIGFSVSVAQYLPTLFTGSGRVPTLTTEAVTLASGADRRITGVLAFLQTILPLLVYAGALFVPGRIYAKRRGLLGQA